MASIAEQLTQLTQDRDDLVDNLTTKGISGLTGDETFTELVPEVLNISGGGTDLSEYFATTIQINGNYPRGSTLITKIPGPLTLQQNPGAPSLTIDCQNLFAGFKNLVEAPEIDTSKCSAFNNMFVDCTNLEYVPIYDVSMVNNMSYMFSGCTHLTDESLNNILYMCANVGSSYTRSKTLSELQILTTNYPAVRIQALSNYQDFIDAGWTIS